MGESKLQKDCINVCKNNSVLVRKVHVEGKRGWPDLLLIFRGSGETVYVEMKNPNGKGVISELQKKEHALIRDQGAAVYFCSDFLYFKEIILKHLVRGPSL